MNYNIDFDIASAAICSVILLFSLLRFTANTLSNGKYCTLTVALLFGAILDAVTGWTNTGAYVIPVGLNVALNTLFFVVSLFAGYTYQRYVSVFIFQTKKHNLNDKIGDVIAILYFAFLIANIFTGMLFYFEDGSYCFGPLHNFGFYIPGYYMLNGFIMAIVYRKKLKPKQLFAIMFFGPCSLIGMLLQMLFFPNILVTYICSTFGCMALLFVIETPDYAKLMKTMSELEKARQEAEVATRAKSDFLAKMSHELRTPMNAVLGMNEMILRESTDNNVIGYAGQVKAAGAVLLSTINDILDFSKIESGKLEIINSEYSLKKMILDCKNLIENRAQEKALEFSIHNDEQLPSVLIGDEMRIRQVIINLLTNAVKYTEKGSIRLDVGMTSIEEPDIVILKISVTDTGMGISENNLPKIFSSFERLEAGLVKTIEGTGLGLSITKQLLDLMGGTVSVESMPGRGSCFTVSLPQKISDRVPVGLIVKAAEKPGKREKYAPLYVYPEARFLVVDDVKTNLVVLTALLKKTEASIDKAESGFEALKLIEANRYDIIFMDHMMPAMDGIETMKRIKSMENNPNASVPIIALTANAVNGAEKMYIEAGFDGYLSKPIGADELEHEISKYMNSREQ